MTGIQAITAQNGWVMALTGAIIVMIGLAILSFLISQLHKIIALFDKKPALPHSPKQSHHHELTGLFILEDLAATARIYQGISSELGSNFELSKLYQLLNREGLPHPHLTIRSLREAGYLVAAGDGSFSWKTE